MSQRINVPEADTKRVTDWIESRQKLLFPIDEEKSYHGNSSHCTLVAQLREMHLEGFAALGDREAQNPEVQKLLAQAETYFLLAYTFSGVLNECLRKPRDRRHRVDKWMHNPSMALSHHFENATTSGYLQDWRDRIGRFLNIEQLGTDEQVQKVAAGWRALKSETPGVKWDDDYQTLNRYDIDWAQMLPVLQEAKNETARRVWRFVHYGGTLDA